MSSRRTPFLRQLLLGFGLALIGAGCVGGASAPTVPIGPATPAALGSPAAVSLPPTPSASALDAPSSLEPVDSPSDEPSAGAAAGAASTAGATLSEADNGKTIQLGVGASVELTLHNVNWRIAGSSDASVLAAVGSPTYSGAGTLKCIPGTGCGTVKATYKAVATGTARISATRLSCGDALQCIDEGGTLEVTVHVVP